MPLQEFLSAFVPKLQKKCKQVNLADWILQTTGSKDAAELKSSRDRAPFALS